ncbi:MAG: precorrin-6y C5,15-methyltransferase (decarboxylating) subunit CbiE, partial [Mariprofundus sp.]
MSLNIGYTRRTSAFLGFGGARVIVLGVLDNGTVGLTANALAILQQADVVIGGSRVLERLADALKGDVHTHDLTGHLKEVPSWIEEAFNKQQSVLVLATGDPLCHGIGNYLKKKIGMEKLIIIPNVSALQLACARVGISWQDAYFCSIHSKDAGEWRENPGKEHGLYPLFKACLQHRKVIVFT